MRISIVIKALNEEKNIARAIESSLAAVAEAGGGEVILADSLSSDRTIQIASKYPVRILQLSDLSDRSCGIGAQLGYQVAHGEYIYILDGDMEFQPGFLAAAAATMDSNKRFAGVGGLVEEMNLDTFESQNRAKRPHRNMRPGRVDRLDGGGLYRRSALEQVGYVTNRNLHAYEELDLSARLHMAGWLLQRLDIPAIRHYGHTVNSYMLLIRRWKTRYAWGTGELLRAAVGRSQLGFIVARLFAFRLYTMVWIGWLALLASFLARNTIGAAAVAASAVIVLGPWLLMTFRKRSLNSALFSIVAWNIHAAGMLCGLLWPPRADPLAPLNYRVIR